MGLQENETASLKDGNPAFLADQDIGDMTTAQWAVVQDVSYQTEDTSIAFSPTRWLPAARTVRGSRGTSKAGARASIAVGVGLLWLFVEAAADKGLCGESNIAQAFVTPTEKGRYIAQPNAMRDESSLVSRVVETTLVEQKQILERGREKIDIIADRLTPMQWLEDSAQDKAAQAPQSAPAWERKQPLEHLEYGQAWGRVEVLGCALTSSLQGELSAFRSAAEAARIKQRQALDQERDRADALARELTSLWAEMDTETLQARDGQVKQKQALEQELRRADALARELASLQAEFDATRIAGSEAKQASEAEIGQKQALTQEQRKSATLR